MIGCAAAAKFALSMNLQHDRARHSMGDFMAVLRASMMLRVVASVPD
jgi:hypothetical protein